MNISNQTGDDKLLGLTNLQLYTVSICNENDKDYNKVSRLRYLSTYELNTVIFMTEKQQGGRQPFEDAFLDDFFGQDSGKTPLFATRENLSKVISDVLLGRIFDILETLSSLLQSLNKTMESGIRSKAKTSESFDKKFWKKKEILEDAIADIESLIRENPKAKQARLRCVPEEIYDQLCNFKDKGFRSCCMYGEDFLIFVDNKDEELAEKIKLAIDKQIKSYYIIDSGHPTIKPLISGGDKIIPERELHPKYGTLGTVVKEKSNKRLFALTDAHVANKNENIYTDDRELFGTCRAVSDKENVHAANLAVIEIESKAIPKCGDPKDIPDLHVFQGPKDEIRDKQRVYKKGAKTKETTGEVVGHFKEITGDFLLVEGLKRHSLFSEGGDSGSIVYMRDLIEDKEVAISMVTAGEYNARDDMQQIRQKSATGSQMVGVGIETPRSQRKDFIEVGIDSPRSQSKVAVTPRMIDIAHAQEQETTEPRDIGKRLKRCAWTFMLNKEIEKLEKQGVKLPYTYHRKTD